MKYKNGKLSYKCPECGSTLIMEYGYIKCTKDLIKHEYLHLFTAWDLLGEEEIEDKIRVASKITQEMHRRWLAGKEAFDCWHNQNEDFNPMTQYKNILPDPMQQKISEYILERELEFDEYYGNKKVPLLDEKGVVYWGFIDQLQFPKDVQPTSRCKFDNTTVGMLPIVFKWDDLK